MQLKGGGIYLAHSLRWVSLWWQGSHSGAHAMNMDSRPLRSLLSR